MTNIDATDFLEIKKRNIRANSTRSYEFHGAMELAIFALKKREPENPPYGLNICPDCYMKQSFFRPKNGIRYCPYCGKAIRWEGK